MPKIRLEKMCNGRLLQLAYWQWCVYAGLCLEPLAGFVGVVFQLGLIFQGSFFMHILA